MSFHHQQSFSLITVTYLIDEFIFTFIDQLIFLFKFKFLIFDTWILSIFIVYQIIIIIRSITRFICTWCWLWIFWFYVLNRSQKSQEISIQRSSNDVRMLCKQKSWSCRVFIYTTTFLLTVTIDLWRWLMTCWCQ